jgi:hypothetical protein
VVHVLQSHIVTTEIIAQREAGIGGLQMQIDQIVDSLQLTGIILMNLGGHG